MSVVEGGLLRVKVGSKVIFHATEASFSSSKEEKEIATKDTGGKITSLSEGAWTISGTMVIFDEADKAAATQMGSGDVIDAYLAESLVSVEFTDGKTGNWIITGQAQFTQYDISAGIDSESTLNYTLKGQGAYSKSTVA